jgi:hypothetical protein
MHPLSYLDGSCKTQPKEILGAKCHTETAIRRNCWKLGSTEYVIHIVTRELWNLNRHRNRVMRKTKNTKNSFGLVAEMGFTSRIGESHCVSNAAKNVIAQAVIQH